MAIKFSKAHAVVSNLEVHYIVFSFSIITAKVHLNLFQHNDQLFQLIVFGKGSSFSIHLQEQIRELHGGMYKGNVQYVGPIYI